MDTDSGYEAAISRIRLLMRIITNLNAAAMLALCLWLSLAAMGSHDSSSLSGGVLRIHGCNCVLHQVTDWAGRTDVASRN